MVGRKKVLWWGGRRCGGGEGGKGLEGEEGAKSIKVDRAIGRDWRRWERTEWAGEEEDIGTWASSCVDCQRTKVASLQQ